MMRDFEWQEFLEQWSRAVLESPDLEHLGLPLEALNSCWLGFAPATGEQIAAVEARLGVTLPPSYRAFLQVTNGWRHTGLGIGRVLPVESIDWFSALHPDWIDAWMTGFTAFGSREYSYDPEYDPVDYRHLSKTLAVSEAGDIEILLLNPQVVSSQGEWEAWLFVEEGASRFDSFWDLLQEEYKILLEVNRSLAKDRSRQRQPSEPPQAIVTKLPGLIAELEEKLALTSSLSANDQVGYQQGVGKGLEMSLESVREGAQGIADPDALRVKLQALTAELEAEAVRLEAPLQKLSHTGLATLSSPIPNLGDMLSQMEAMMEGVRLGAKAQGLRQGAGIIRWFLNEGYHLPGDFKSQK